MVIRASLPEVNEWVSEWRNDSIQHIRDNKFTPDNYRQFPPFIQSSADRMHSLDSLDASCVADITPCSASQSCYTMHVCRTACNIDAVGLTSLTLVVTCAI